MSVSKHISELPDEDKVVTIADSIAFFIFIAVLVCRLFVTESLYNSMPLLGEIEGTGIFGFGGPGYILGCSMLLVTTCTFWLYVRCWQYDSIIIRLDVLIACLMLFVGLSMSISVASNRYIAIIEGLNLLSIFISGLVMVVLLEKRINRIILISIVIALGCSGIYRCYQQKYYEQGQTVTQMEADYYGFMEARGLDGDSWQARQLQERISSMDSGGYFSISNTAASFFLLTLAGGLCLIAGVSAESPTRIIERLAGATVALISLAGIYITESTGGKMSALLIAIFIIFMLIFSRFRCRKCVFIAVFMLLIVAILAVVGYGLKYDRLPTSNLWIRWQYWQATAKLISDNWLRGVGPGNFGIHYLQYMNPGSPEAVKDPHNVGLAILSQWGIFGFMALAWSALATCYYLAVPAKSSEKKTVRPETNMTKPTFSFNRLIILVVALLVAIVIANLFSIDNTYGEVEAIVFGWIVGSRALLFGLVLFVVGYCLLCKQWYSRLANSSGAIVVLVAVLAGFAIHNSIDFAFFDPAVCMLFFFIVALALSIRKSVSGFSDRRILKVGNGKVIGIVLILTVLSICFKIGTRVYQAEALLSRASTMVVDGSRSGRVDLILSGVALADKSWQANRISPAGLSYSARILAQLWQAGDYRTDKYFDDAISYLEKAATVDRSNPEYSRRAGELWYERSSLFANGTDRQKQFLSEASKWLEKHLQMYPGNADAMAILADINSKQGRQQQAIELAKQALAIEAECMRLQPKLFPHRKEFYPRMDIELQEKMKLIISSELPSENR